LRKGGEKNENNIFYDPEYCQDMKTGEFIHIKTGKKVKLLLKVKHKQKDNGKN